MLSTHKNEKALISDSTRRVFLRTGVMGILSAGFWLEGETIAFGQSNAQADAKPQPENSAFQLTRSKFSPHLSEFYLVRLNGEDIYLQLIEVADLKQTSISTSALSKKEDAAFNLKLNEESFTLLFRSISQIHLSQRMWNLEREFDKIELFLVPIEKADSPWHFYEAVFNRLQF